MHRNRPVPHRRAAVAVALAVAALLAPAAGSHTVLAGEGNWPGTIKGVTPDGEGNWPGTPPADSAPVDTAPVGGTVA